MRAANSHATLVATAKRASPIVPATSPPRITGLRPMRSDSSPKNRSEGASTSA